MARDRLGNSSGQSSSRAPSRSVVITPREPSQQLVASSRRGRVAGFWVVRWAHSSRFPGQLVKQQGPGSAVAPGDCGPSSPAAARVALALTTLLGVTACGSSGGTGAAPPGSPGQNGHAAAQTTAAPTSAQTSPAGTNPSTQASTIAPSSTSPRPRASERPSSSPPVSRGGPCTSDQFTVAFSAASKSVGTTLTQAFTMVNQGPSTCTLSGYPALSPYGDSGTPVLASVMPIPASAGPIGAGPGTVTVAPGSAALFFLQWRFSGTTCQNAAGLVFTAPGARPPPSLVPFPFKFCGREIRQSVVFPNTG